MVSRRHKGEGSIYKRGDGRWTGAVSFLSQDGERKRRVVYGKTAEEVRRKLRDVRRRVEAGEPARDSSIKVADWVEQRSTGALEASGRKQVAIDNYRTIAKNHVSPSPFGDKRLDRITTSDVERLLLKKRDEGKSASTRRIILTVLRDVFDVAQRDGKLQRNPAAFASRPKLDRSEARFLDVPEISRLMIAFKDDPLEPVLNVMIGTGMRRGEVLALRWDDVDFQRAEVRVRHTLSRTSNGLKLTTPKTQKSVRVLPLPNSVVAVLKSHQRRQKAVVLAMPPGIWRNENFVFANEFGGPLEPRNVLRRFKAKAKEAGFEGIGLHTLRHSTASILLAAGAHMKMVQEQLGHSSYEITAEIYSHVTERAKREVADLLDDQLGAMTRE